MPTEVALDTTVVFKANVPLTLGREGARLARRLNLLRQIRHREVVVLVSLRLLHEYVQQVKPHNEFTKAFLELATSPDGSHVILNWKNSWSGDERSRARQCRYPAEDVHVLRTAIRETPTTIYTEEARMLAANTCIFRAFGVHIAEP